jgi:hypothetical protein
MSFPSPQPHQSFDPVSPIDIVSGKRVPQFAQYSEKKTPSVTGRSARTGSSSSTSSSKLPRTARFAEATSVNSPVTEPNEKRSPFADPPEMSAQEAKPSDVGFGYISNEPVEQQAALKKNNLNAPLSPPLKSALKTPGTPGRNLNPLSPTFREEQILEKHEEDTEKEQAKDLVRLASHSVTDHC